MRLRLNLLILLLAISLGHTPPAQAVDNRVIDVVSVTWSGAKSSVGIGDVESAVRNEVSRRWKTYTSIEGSAEDRSINFQLGRTLNSPIILNRPMACEGSEASSFMRTIREETYQRLGIDDWSKRYLIILSPEAGCIWSGRALIGDIKLPTGVMTLHNSASAFIIVHELGHSFGLGHSNFLRCDSGKSDGAWGDGCKAVEYGGAVDVMGNVDVDTPLSVYNQWLIGYLDKKEIKQSWLSEKIELTASDVSGGYRAIFLRDGKSAYWIEYRRAKVGAPYNPGLVIYRSDPPPISTVVSPNPEDLLSPEFDEDLTSDIWMLNWDNYTYFGSKSSGSMSLPEGKTATVFSGNIAISASASSSPNMVTVSINRKADTTPPPAPELVDPSNWRYPGISLIQPNFDDGESAIASYEAKVDGNVIPITASETVDFIPTYLNPLAPIKTVYLKDLPEGNYSVSLRAIDVWGNKGEWSKTVRAYVDRGNPIVTGDYALSSIDENETVISWTGVKDEGVGLCDTLIHNEEGFVLARSSEKSSPKFTLKTGDSISAKAQIFDCLGNGMIGEISASTSFVPAGKSRRTGRWSAAPASYGPGALRCSGKCTASISAKGTVSVMTSEGAVELRVANAIVQKIAKSAQQIRFSEPIIVGKSSKVVRVTGSNFVFSGLASVSFNVSKFEPRAKSPELSDSSLIEPIQKEMSRFGFSNLDFTPDWSVLPMARGTTLQDPTLDLCAANYTSESGREVRRQISVTKVGSPYLFLSSESVKYKSVAAAEAALTELTKNYEACVKNKGGTENGLFTSYVFQNLPKSDVKLVAEEKRVVVRATIGTGAAARQLLAFYQYSGAYFTGLYIVLAGEKPIADTEVTRWFDVAEVMAKRLEAGSSGK